jgi:tyrosine-protein phosphatase SIW14
MAQKRRTLLALGVILVVAGGPVAFYRYREIHERNFRVVVDGVLYRSGQLTPAGLERLIRERGIRTVVSLRKHERSDGWEEAFCAERGVRHVRIVPRVWAADEEGDIPAEQAVREFLEVMDNPAHYPVLVHCFAGIHRTGTMVAIFRMEYQGWTLEQALAEMHHCGFEPEDMEQDIAVYLRSYTPRRHPRLAPAAGHQLVPLLVREPRQGNK